MKEDEEISSIDALRKNLLHEKNIVKEASLFLKYLESLDDLARLEYRINLKEREILAEVINSLMTQLRILNDSIPEIVKRISAFREFVSEKEAEKGREKINKSAGELISLKYKHPAVEEKQASVTIKKEDRLKFLRELSLTDSSVKRLKKDYKLEKIKFERFKKPNFYAKFSNKLFLKLSGRLIEKGYFQNLNRDLRQSNLLFLSYTYLSMAFFTSLISVFASIILLVLLLFFNLSINFPFLVRIDEFILLRLAKTFWIVFAIPILTFIGFYFYPSLEKRSISTKINQELPFVVIHMSAIAGSGVEPTKIFEIIVKSEEYPNTKKEIKKLLNQINLYGYDLVSALRESARITSSSKLAELLKGLATTITSGGELTSFLDKRAETLVFDYKVEREKYNRIAETFMDIYISVVIAAPMMMTLLLVMMSMTGMSFGLTIQATSLIIILIIGLLNIFFLIFLHLKQPEV